MLTNLRAWVTNCSSHKIAQNQTSKGRACCSLHVPDTTALRSRVGHQTLTFHVEFWSIVSLLFASSGINGWEPAALKGNQSSFTYSLAVLSLVRLYYLSSVSWDTQGCFILRASRLVDGMHCCKVWGRGGVLDRFFIAVQKVFAALRGCHTGRVYFYFDVRQKHPPLFSIRVATQEAFMKRLFFRTSQQTFLTRVKTLCGRPFMEKCGSRILSGR